MTDYALFGTIIPIAFLALFIVLIAKNTARQKGGIKPVLDIDGSWLFIIGSLLFLCFVNAAPKFVHEFAWALQKEDPKAIDALVMEAANCLDAEANWTCGDHSRKIYEDLKNWKKPDYVTNALVRLASKEYKRLQVLYLAIKLGIPGTEEKLLTMLMENGDKKMAEDYLNSGSAKLHEGGALWATRNGFAINTGAGSHRAFWGIY